MISKILLVFWIIVFIHWAFPVACCIGNSMYPTLKSGDVIIYTRLFFKIKVDGIYMFLRPIEDGSLRHVTKRVTEKVDNKLFVEGDNPSGSFDSRHYGYIDAKDVEARYLFTIKKWRKKK